MNTSQIAKAADEYLSSRPYILWAGWDLKTSDGRDKAIEWLTVQIEEVLSRLPEPPPSKKKSKGKVKGAHRTGSEECLPISA